MALEKKDLVLLAEAEARLATQALELAAQFEAKAKPEDWSEAERQRALLGIKRTQEAAAVARVLLELAQRAYYG
jgi:hypothetical protein